MSRLRPASNAPHRPTNTSMMLKLAPVVKNRQIMPATIDEDAFNGQTTISICFKDDEDGQEDEEGFDYLLSLHCVPI